MTKVEQGMTHTKSERTDWNLPAITLEVARRVLGFARGFLHGLVRNEHHECAHDSHLGKRQGIVNLLAVVDVQLTFPELLLLELLQPKLLDSCIALTKQEHVKTYDHI